MNKTAFKKSAYEVLGVEKENLDDIKTKYLELLRKHTPEHDPEKFMEIREAFELLTKSEGNENIYFLYKKPLSFFENIETPKNKLDKTIIQEIFETPFGTNLELEKLLTN